MQTTTVLRIFSNYFRIQEVSGITKEIYPAGSSGEANHIAFHTYTCIVGRHSWHGGFVLSFFYAGLYIRPDSGRTHGKFRHDKLFPHLIDCIDCHIPQKIIINPMTRFIAGLFIDNNKN